MNRAHRGADFRLGQRLGMAQAAAKHGGLPRTLSLKGALPTLKAFQPLIATIRAGDRTRRERLDGGLLDGGLLDAIATHRVANRPDRSEPRRKKKRKASYDLLMRSRAETKLDILKEFRV